MPPGQIDHERPEGEDRNWNAKRRQHQTDAFNQLLVGFYQRSLLFSYKKAVGWGVLAATIMGLVILGLEFQQRGGQLTIAK